MTTAVVGAPVRRCADAVVLVLHGASAANDAVGDWHGRCLGCSHGRQRFHRARLLEACSGTSTVRTATDRAIRSTAKLQIQAAIEDAASSATKNIAEGFGRYGHKEFAQFLKIALGSEFEVRDSLIEAFDRNYITPSELNEGLALTRRAIGATTKLRRHLLTIPTPPPRPRPQQKPGKGESSGQDG